MSTVTLQKTEYEQLKRFKQQMREYQKITARLFELVREDPAEAVVHDFRKTNLYTEAFLNDLEGGLRKSSYTRRHAHKTNPKRS